MVLKSLSPDYCDIYEYWKLWILQKRIEIRQNWYDKWYDNMVSKYWRALAVSPSVDLLVKKIQDIPKAETFRTCLLKTILKSSQITHASFQLIITLEAKTNAVFFDCPIWLCVDICAVPNSSLVSRSDFSDLILPFLSLSNKHFCGLTVACFLSWVSSFQLSLLSVECCEERYFYILLLSPQHHPYFIVYRLHSF